MRGRLERAGAWLAERWRPILLLGACALTPPLIAVALVNGDSDPEREPITADSGPGRSQPQGPPPPAAPRPQPRKLKHADPPAVTIPAIGVSETMIPLGLKADKSLEVPTDFGTPGWWEGGPEPGQPGAAVIVGHVDSSEGPGIFYRLRQLRPGDRVIVTDQSGRKSRFAVRSTEQVPKNDFPTDRVYTPTPGPTLRLVTCGGAFNSGTGHYVDNHIVYATPA